ncbi:putative inorganic phosphate cotransporter [Phymastichus coffea]|uniref:putative inorganic phosphate cotransporter n=1 Tax=Phymastichus coffea TaxID=108790 RepID=UPI00273BE844|nr:putative inorganic phosphate cotransporter [Phymastichus coffea]
MVIKTGRCEKQSDVTCESSNNINPLNKTFLANQDEALIQRYPWDEYTQGIILSSFFWSATIYHFFSGPLAERYGGKHLLGFGIFSQAVLTCVTPFLINWGGSTALIITRVLAGIAFGGMYPISSKMISHWTTSEDRTKVGNAVYSGSVLGLFFGNILPALIIKCSGMGWPSVFYFMGILGIIWFPFWLVLVYENPQVHPFISDEELEYFENSSETKKDKTPPPPWKHILMCREFWAFTVDLVGANWSFYVMVSDLPKYMDSVIKFSLESNGYFSSLPYIFMWLISVASAWVNDKILENQWMSLTNVRKLLTTLSNLGPAIFLLLASYAGQDKTMVVIMFIIGVALIGCSYPSLMMNPLDLSPKYAGSIMSIGTGIGSIVGIITPYLVGVLVPNSTLTEWRLVFWIVFLFAAVSNIIYLYWFRAEVQPWNNTDFITNSEEEKNIELHKRLMVFS